MIHRLFRQIAHIKVWVVCELAESETVVNSCELMPYRLPDSGKEAPLFFPENVFFTLSVINVRPPHPAGPPPLHPWGPRASSGPGPVQEVASSLNRLPFPRRQLSLR